MGGFGFPTKLLSSVSGKTDLVSRSFSEENQAFTKTLVRNRSWQTVHIICILQSSILGVESVVQRQSISRYRVCFHFELLRVRLLRGEDDEGQIYSSTQSFVIVPWQSGERFRELKVSLFCWLIRDARFS
jgi:hypothetical protein